MFFIKGNSGYGIVGDETIAKLGHTEELFQSLRAGRGREIKDGLNSSRIKANFSLIDNVSKIWGLRLEKTAFEGIECKPSITNTS